MGYVPSRKFCCCIPMRFGVFIMSILGFAGGSISAGVGWHAATHRGPWQTIFQNRDLTVPHRSSTFDQEPGNFRCGYFLLIYGPCHRFYLWVRRLYALVLPEAEPGNQVNWNHHQTPELCFSV